MSVELLTKLIEAGTPAALVAEVAMELAKASASSSGEKRPSKAALRQRAYRERHNSQQNETNNGDVTKCDAGDEPVTEVLSLDKSPQTPKIKPNPVDDIPARKAWACPDGVNPRHWADFLANRKQKKLAKTETAYLGQLRELAKFTSAEWPPGRIMQRVAELGWGGIYDPRTSSGHGNGQRSSQNGRYEHQMRDHVLQLIVDGEDP
jgi:hypothetical protein